MFDKCLVNMPRPNLKSATMIKKGIKCCFIVDLKPLLEKANQTMIDSFLDNPNPLIRNVSAQPIRKCLTSSFPVKDSS